MTDEDFQRARSPEQKEERRELLLHTARQMLRENIDSRELSLNDLARRAQMAKSNIYRYFESREAILLELLWLEWSQWFLTLQSTMAVAPDENICSTSTPSQNAADDQALNYLAELIASTTAQHPFVGQLTSIMPSVLERNCSAATIQRFKLGSLQFVQELAQFLTAHPLTPRLDAARYGEFIHLIITHLVGLWPLSHPQPHVAEVLSDPALADFRHDFERDFARGIVLIGKGLLREFSANSQP